MLALGARDRAGDTITLHAGELAFDVAQFDSAVAHTDAIGAVYVTMSDGATWSPPRGVTLRICKALPSDWRPTVAGVRSSARRSTWKKKPRPHDALQ